jgi:abortive infection alpha-like protein
VPDDPGLEMISAGTEGAARGLVQPVVDAARAMVAAVFGDTADALDEYFAQRISARTRVRRIETFARAKAMCDEAGIDPGEVGLKVLHPIMLGAALEDEDSMTDRWAALLANASAGEDAQAPVSPAFPKILADLGPPEAAILDRLAAEPGSRYLFQLQADLYPESTDPTSGVITLMPAFDLYTTNLDRLGLCAITRPDAEVRKLQETLNRERNEQRRQRPRGQLGAPNVPPAIRISPNAASISITEWGKAFVAACTAPAGPRTGPHPQ